MTLRKSHRSQLSLLNVMLLMAIAALVAAIVSLQRGNAQARLRTTAAEARTEALEAEAAKLREEHGVLAYGDQDKIRAIEIFEPRTDMWSYRVYVPPGATYCVACQINNLPLPDPMSGEEPPVYEGNQLPGPNAIKRLGADAFSGGITPGEYTVTLTVYETPDGKAHCSLDVQGKTTQQRTFSTGGQLPHDPKKPLWPRRPVPSRDTLVTASRGTTSVGRKTKAADPDKPLILMTLRTFGDNGIDNSGDSSEGVMLWVQKVADQTDQ